MRCSPPVETDQGVGDLAKGAIEGALVGDRQLALLRLAEPHLVMNLSGVKDGLQGSGRDAVNARRGGGELHAEKHKGFINSIASASSTIRRRSAWNPASAPCSDAWRWT